METNARLLRQAGIFLLREERWRSDAFELRGGAGSAAGEGYEALRNVLGSRRVGLGASRGAHGKQPIVRREQIHEGLEKPGGRFQIGLIEHDGGAGGYHLFGVSPLVIVGRGGKGNKQGRLSSRGQLGDGGGAAAGHD